LEFGQKKLLVATNIQPISAHRQSFALSNCLLGLQTHNRVVALTLIARADWVKCRTCIRRKRVLNGLLGSISLLLGIAPAVWAEPLRDPMQPYGWQSMPTASATAEASSASTATLTWTVTGIIVSAKRRLAMLNGQLVAEGDRLNNHVVVRITHNAVILQHEAERLMLPFPPMTLKEHAQLAE